MNKLLFVCGFPSGGTDLIKTILNVHPDVYLNGEMQLLHNIAKHGFGPNTRFSSLEEILGFQKLLSKLNTWSNIENIDHDFASQLQSRKELTLEEVLRKCFSRQSKTVWGNKTPQNTEHIARLAELFPQALFLIVVRDVRDVCLSWNNKWGKDMIWCAKKWADRMKAGRLASQQIDKSRCLFIRYEDILLDTEPCLRMVCKFLDLPFSHQILEHQKYTTKTIDGKLNYGKKIIKNNIAKWQHQLHPKVVKRIEEIAYQTMEIYDYKSVYALGQKQISLLETCRGVLNDIYAVTVIGNRAGKHNNFAQRTRELMFHLKTRGFK